MALAPRARKHANTPGKKTFCSSQVFTRLVPLFNFNSSFGAIMSNHFWGIRSLDAQNKPLPSRKVWLKLSTARAGTHQAQKGQQVKVKWFWRSPILGNPNLTVFNGQRT
jgi:hypothetical protein